MSVVVAVVCVIVVLLLVAGAIMGVNRAVGGEWRLHLSPAVTHRCAAN